MINCYKCLSKLKELIHKSLLDTVSTIAGNWANKTTELHVIAQSKKTQLQPAAKQKNATRPTETGIFLPLNEFHEHLNKQNTSIQFTKEIEEKGKIPKLDCSITHKNNTQQTTVYRKPTHTADYLTTCLTILLHTKWLLNKPWREEHKLFATHSTVRLMKPSTWTLFLLRPNNYSTDFQQTTNKALSARVPKF